MGVGVADGDLNASQRQARLELDVVLLLLEKLRVQAFDLCQVFERFDWAVVCAVLDKDFDLGRFEGEAGFNLFGGGCVDVDGLAEIAGEVADYGFDFFFGAFSSSGDHVIDRCGPEFLGKLDLHYPLDGVAVGTHLDEGLFLFGLGENVLGREGEGEDCQQQCTHNFIFSLNVVSIE